MGNSTNIIKDVISKHNLDIKKFDNYTDEIAKIIDFKKTNRKAKLVIVTSMSPTPVGEGKTTTSIGLVDGLNSMGIKAIGALRQPSMGPVFGMKGTGSGSNKSMLLPFDKINLHFTGDFHAITSANNLISSIIENEIYQNSELKINPNKILWKRCLDVNDRSLRNIQYKIKNNSPIDTSFNITAASDLMALFCLSKSIKDFEQKINNTIVAYDVNNNPIKIKDLEIVDALTTILKDAFYPNLVRTLEDNPVIIHGGPFANIAHGCSSILSIETAMNISDVVITEAGFGSDLGLEKFMDITCTEGEFSPDLIILTISLKSILYNGQYNEEQINSNLLTNKQKIVKGFKNVLHHIEHCRFYNKPLLIAINHRQEDKMEDMQLLTKMLDDLNVDYAINDSWAKGSIGAKGLANKAWNIISSSKTTKHIRLYKDSDSITKKIKNISKIAYGADDVIFSEHAEQQLKDIKDFSHYYVCISKNPYSLTCDQKILGKPKHYNTVIERIEINHASKFIIPITSVVYRMPGLPKNPKAKNFVMK